jgi:hypothetical protein
MASAITQLASMSDDARERMGGKGRAYLAAHFDKQSIIDEYERVLSTLANSQGSRPMSAEERAR